MHVDRRTPILNAGQLCAALCLSLVAFFAIAPGAGADPATPYLDPLIAELQARSDALADSTDKIELKQKKTLDGLLKALAKPSKGPDQDLKNLGKLASKLAKVFPGEFPVSMASSAPASTISLVEVSLVTLIQQALELFGGDIEALLAAAQSGIDGLSPGCRGKAQALLDKVVASLEAAWDSPDVAGTAKLLAKALKDASKTEPAIAKAAACVPKLGKDVSVVLLNVSDPDDADPNHVDQISLYDDLSDYNEAFITGTFSKPDDRLDVLISSFNHQVSLSFFRVLGSDPLGIYFVLADVTYAGGSYDASGNVTITAFPKLPGHVQASFDLHGTGIGGTMGEIDMTGSFTIYTYEAL